MLIGEEGFFSGYRFASSSFERKPRKAPRQPLNENISFQLSVIFQGISTGSIEILLAGAIPTAILAIVVDLGFAGIERLKIPAELRRRKF